MQTEVEERVKALPGVGLEALGLRAAVALPMTRQRFRRKYRYLSH